MPPAVIAPLACPVCCGAKLSVFFEGVNVPVHCNRIHGSRAEARATPRGDLRLGFCERCAMIYNVSFDPSRMAYGEEYENALHGSRRFREYADALAGRLVADHALTAQPVVEIGCGDGDFLRRLRRHGAGPGFGFDPSYRPGPGADGLGPGAEALTVVTEPFRSDRVPGGAGLICCRHVLEHVDDPRGFVRSVRDAAGRGRPATVFFEVPDTRATLAGGAIWDILYEHCSYFTPPSLARLFEEEGFRVLRTASDFDGQFLQIEAVPAESADVADRSADVADLAVQVDRFADAYRAKLEHWRRTVVESGRPVVAWGAGTKGVMFLNALDPDAVRVAAIVDINPLKHGAFVAGTGHPIVSPEALRDLRPATVLVMNGAYLAEIAAQLPGLGLEADVRVV